MRAGPNSSWPVPGQWLHTGRPLGWIDIRIGAQERLALQDNLNSAHLKKQGAEKLVQLQRERVRPIEKVSLSQIVPGQTLDDARVLLTDAETQLAIATAATEPGEKHSKRQIGRAVVSLPRSVSPCSLRPMARSRSWLLSRA